MQNLSYQGVHADGKCSTNLCLLLARHQFGSEFPGVQWETANRINFTIPSAYKYAYNTTRMSATIIAVIELLNRVSLQLHGL